MKFIGGPALLVVAAFAAGTLQLAAGCDCVHNDDAGRWKDKNSPAGEAAALVDQGGGCYKADTQGNMCVSFIDGNANVKTCLSEAAANWQSFHGDWFLWTAITCSDGAAKALLTITL